MLKQTITRTHRQSSVVLPLIFAFAGSLAAQIIEPRIVSETLPSGSLMQIKMELTSPHPILTGGARFEMDSSFSGFDGVSVFSPNGDAYGAALLRGQTFTANIVSPQASLGTQLDYPFLVVASRIKAGIAAGTQIPINFSPNFVLNAPGGTPYTYVVTNGILTIGGSISVDNVIPGGGVLAAGTTVRILGTGFTPTTQLAPGTLLINNFRYVSPTELNFEMGQTASITGQRLRVKNPANNNEVVYFSYLRAVNLGASGRTLLNGVHPIFQEATSFTSAALTVPAAPSVGFIALALQNSGSAQTVVQLQLVSAGGSLLGSTSVTMPGGTRWARTLDELFNSAPPTGSTVRIVSPLAIKAMGLSGDESAGDVTAFLAAAATPPPTITLTPSPASLQFAYQIGAAAPANQSVGLSTSGGAAAYSASSNASWLTVSLPNGQAPATLSVSVNPAGLAAGQYNGAITVDALGAAAVTIPVTLNVTAGSGGGGGTQSVGLRFVPVTPCRLVDTRLSPGPFGAPGLAAGSARAFALPQSNCGIPAGALAYSLNVTVVPTGPLGYLTIWPTGAAQPLVSTLNSLDGRIKANAALVPAGVGGSVSVFSTGATELVLDVNGYFVDAATSPQALVFFPLTPCRVADTRSAAGPLGAPVLAGGAVRSFPVLSANCGVPANAQAYSLNSTVVPNGPLGYLTLWPTGQAQPLVSTLNALTGAVVANAAIVPAGPGGSISAFVTSQTHLVLDINGYFAPAGAANAQRFFTVTPCRLADTRLAVGEFGGSVLAAGQQRSYRLPLAGCGLPSTAAAYSVNATVVPVTTLGYLTLWPSGTAQPLVSTLNAFDDPIVANAAIVPAGTDAAVSSFATNATELILDTNGYFAP